MVKLIVLMLIAESVCAADLYRCESIFSDKPCSPDAVAVPLKLAQSVVNDQFSQDSYDNLNQRLNRMVVSEIGYRWIKKTNPPTLLLIDTKLSPTRLPMSALPKSPRRP